MIGTAVTMARLLTYHKFEESTETGTKIQVKLRKLCKLLLLLRSASLVLF